MINWLVNLWYNYQLKLALKQNRQIKAQKLLQRLEKSGAKLSVVAKLYQDWLKSNNSLICYRQEISLLTRRLQEVTPDTYYLQPQTEVINYIYDCFQLINVDSHLIQSTGIDQAVFVALEQELVEYLEAEFSKVPEAKRDREINQALNDLTGLKQGIDPQYNCRLTPHIYFIKYFLENVYCIYLAWFLIYQQGLLKQDLKILDIAAGVGTSIFSLALLASNLDRFHHTSLKQINYYSLERQADLQYRGLQFWRKYTKSCTKSLNTYFRFNTADLFDYQNYRAQLPRQFFDFMIISHCFFYESETRKRSHQIYRQIFEQNLSYDGRVLLIVQGKKLFNAYDSQISEDVALESQLIQMFVAELGLKLDWYKYLSSTNQRVARKSEFYQYAKNNLFPQQDLSNLSKTYLKQHYLSHYAIDDYIILARSAKTQEKNS